MAGMVAGRLNKQIAEDLGISIKTVEQHRARVMEKLQVDSLAELVRLVVGMGGAEASKNGQRTGRCGARSRPRQAHVPGFPGWPGGKGLIWR